MEDIKHFSRFKIFQAGTGGTGGYLSIILSKFIKNLAAHRNFNIDYHLYDADVIEEKNIIRQNFFANEVGLHKAEVIAKRYGIEHYTNSFLTPDHIALEALDSSEGVNVILGCTDSVDFRISMAHYLKSLDPSDFLWVYIDGGNLDKSGQVYVMSNLTKSNIYSKDLNDVEGIFTEFKGTDEYKAEIGESCANLGDQTIGMNFTSALYMYNIVTEFLGSSRISCNFLRFRRYEIFANFDINMAFETEAY